MPRPDPKSRRRSTILLCAMLAAVTLAVFWPARGYDYVHFDDPQYVTENPRVLEGLTWENIGWAWRTSHHGFWHPVTWISHMLDVELAGTGPAWPHFVNLLFHIANSILVFLVFRQMTGAHWCSFVAGALFALHPLRVESVAWVCERKDVLHGFFGLLALWAYARFARNASERNRAAASPIGPTPRFWTSAAYWLAVFFFALGLMSKPMLVTFPFVLLLVDAWPLRRINLSAPVFSKPAWASIGGVLLEKIPFFALTIAVSALTFSRHNAKGIVASTTDLSIVARIENAFVSYARYLGKVFWPFDLAVFYPHPGDWPTAFVVFSIALILTVTILAIVFRGRFPFLFVGWFWFVGMLVPVIGLTQAGSQSMADRFTYLPLVGLLLAVVWILSELFLRWNLPKPAVGVLACILVAACAVRTKDQLRHWRDSEALFRHAVATTENNSLMHYHLAFILQRQGRLPEALEHYQAQVRIAPNDFDGRYDLALCLTRAGQIQEAIEHYRVAIRLNPAHSGAHNNLATALAERGDISEAIEHFKAALLLDPNNVRARNNAGVMLTMAGEYGQAIEHLSEALRQQPNYADARYNLGNALAGQGKFGEAINHYEVALKLEPRSAKIRINLAAVLATDGKFDRSAAEYQEVLRIDPGNPLLHYDLGRVLAKLERRSEAIAHFQEALRLKPDFKEAAEQLTLVSGER